MAEIQVRKKSQLWASFARKASERKDEKKGKVNGNISGGRKNGEQKVGERPPFVKKKKKKNDCFQKDKKLGGGGSHGSDQEDMTGGWGGRDQTKGKKHSKTRKNPHQPKRGNIRRP